MGFGLICAGLLTLLFLRLIPAELVGFTVISMGLSRLSKYNVFFKAALYFSYALVAFSAVDAVFWILKFTTLTDGMAYLETVLSYVHAMLLLPFQIVLFKALEVLSRELGFTKGAKRAVLASSAVTVYYITFALSCVSLPIDVYIDFAVLILFFVSFATTFLAVYSCYRAITTDEAEEKEEEKLKKFEQQFGHKKKTASTKRDAKKSSKT